MENEALFAALVLIAAAALSPGPNNVVVLHAAGRTGLGGVWPTILGINLGGLALLTISMGGAAELLQQVPGVRSLMTLTGCLLLSWLGLRLVAGSLRQRDAQAEPVLLRPGLASMFWFQFANPKSWLLVWMAIAITGADLKAYVQLVLLFALVPLGSQLLWAGLGRSLSRLLARPRFAQWFDRVTGGVLLMMGGMLWLHQGGPAHA